MTQGYIQLTSRQCLFDFRKQEADSSQGIIVRTSFMTCDLLRTVKVVKTRFR